MPGPHLLIITNDPTFFPINSNGKYPSKQPQNQKKLKSRSHKTTSHQNLIHSSNSPRSPIPGQPVSSVYECTPRLPTHLNPRAPLLIVSVGFPLLFHNAPD